MPHENPAFTVGGTIRTARFVKVSTAADHTVLEADANEATIGISSDAAQDAPIPGASTNAGETGDSMMVNPIGSCPLLTIGSGGCTRGDELKSDADGKGVTRATTGATMQWVGAIAMESASEDELCRVMVVRYPIYPALS